MWLPVRGYENIYEVSDSGEVRTSLGKVTFTEKHGIRKWKQRTLKKKPHKRGDWRVDLWREGKPKTFLVHRLVADAFISKVEGKPHVNHIDGNPSNNHVSNLEWCDHKDNNNHAFDNGLMTTNKEVTLIYVETGEEHYFRSLARASTFLGYNGGYLSSKLLKGITTVDGYNIRRN